MTSAIGALGVHGTGQWWGRATVALGIHGTGRS
jgi:hypothetical protein